MTTTIPSPQYPPETCVKICLINFSITESGLKDQMLSLAVSIEKSDLEQERNNLIETNAKNEKILKDKEDEILADLQSSDPETILNEDDLINKLYNTKSEATRIKKDQQVAKTREDQIRMERNK
jgi:dynein heavy chain